MSTIPAHSRERSTSHSGGHGEMSMRSLRPFLAIAFGLAWGLLAVMILFTRQIEAVFGPVSGTNPLFILAVYAPGIAAVLLVWWHYGRRGLGRFCRRITLWRMPLGWWAFLLIGIPAVKYLGSAINGRIGDPFPFTPWYTVLPALAITLFIGPLGEEFGWRGVALPLLQRRFAPLWASLILGTIWGAWHLPAFVLGGTPESAWSFWPLRRRRLGPERARHFNVQCGSGQHSDRRALPLPDESADLARGAALGELSLCSRCRDRRDHRARVNVCAAARV